MLEASRRGRRGDQRIDVVVRRREQSEWAVPLRRPPRPRPTPGRTNARVCHAASGRPRAASTLDPAPRLPLAALSPPTRPLLSALSEAASPPRPPAVPRCPPCAPSAPPLPSGARPRHSSRPSRPSSPQGSQAGQPMPALSGPPHGPRRHSPHAWSPAIDFPCPAAQRSLHTPIYVRSQASLLQRSSYSLLCSRLARPPKGASGASDSRARCAHASVTLFASGTTPSPPPRHRSVSAACCPC